MPDPTHLIRHPTWTDAQVNRAIRSTTKLRRTALRKILDPDRDDKPQKEKAK